MEDKDKEVIYLRNPRIKQQLLDIKNCCRLFKIDYFSANELNARLAFTIGFFLTVKSKNEEDKADKWFKKLMEIDKKEREAKEKGNLEEENVENIEKGKEALKSALEKIDKEIDIPEKEKPNILALVNLMWNNRENKVYNHFPQFSCFEVQFANNFLNLDEVPTKAFYYNPLKRNANEEKYRFYEEDMFKSVFIFISYPIISKEDIVNNKSVILAIPDSSDEDKLNPSVKLIFPSMLNYMVPGRSEDYEICLKEEYDGCYMSHNESNTWAKCIEERTKLFYKEVLNTLKTIFKKLKLEEILKGNVKEALSEMDSLIEHINMINIKTLYDANKETYEIFEKAKKELKEAKLILENMIINNKNIKKKIRSNLDLISPECGHNIENVIDIRLSFIERPRLEFLTCKTCGEIIDNFTLNRLLGRDIKKYMSIIAKQWPDDCCMLCYKEGYYLYHDIHRFCYLCIKKGKNGKCPIPFCNKEIKKEEMKKDNNPETSIEYLLEEESERSNNTTELGQYEIQQFSILDNEIEENINTKSNIEDVKIEKSSSDSDEKLVEDFKCPKGHLMLRCGIKEQFTNCFGGQNIEDYKWNIECEYICRLCLKNKEAHNNQNCYLEVFGKIKDGKVMCKECLFILSGSSVKECYLCGANIKNSKDYITPGNTEEVEKIIKDHFTVDSLTLQFID